MSKEYKKLDFWNNILEVNNFNEECAKYLVSAIQKMRKTSRRTRIGKWISQFGKLRTLDGIKKKRIKNVLIWYVLHLKDKYVPKVYSANGFRNKFFQIEAAMDAENDEEKFDVKVVTTKKGKITKHIIYYEE